MWYVWGVVRGVWLCTAVWESVQCTVAWQLFLPGRSPMHHLHLRTAREVLQQVYALALQVDVPPSLAKLASLGGGGKKEGGHCAGGTDRRTQTLRDRRAGGREWRWPWMWM